MEGNRLDFKKKEVANNPFGRKYSRLGQHVTAVLI